LNFLQWCNAALQSPYKNEKERKREIVKNRFFIGTFKFFRAIACILLKVFEDMSLIKKIVFVTNIRERNCYEFHLSYSYNRIRVGYSVILHGYSRTTGDMDIRVERTPENYAKIADAFLQFKMPVFEMTKENFLNHPIWI
jgi:hypothetical protein